jgi:hypothetical protein
MGAATLESGASEWAGLSCPAFWNRKESAFSSRTDHRRVSNFAAPFYSDTVLFNILPEARKIITENNVSLQPFSRLQLEGQVHQVAVGPPRSSGA